MDIQVTLSSDAHQPERILYEFERGLARLREAGFKKLARFRDREVWSESLDEALVPLRT